MPVNRVVLPLEVNKYCHSVLVSQSHFSQNSSQVEYLLLQLNIIYFLNAIPLILEYHSNMLYEGVPSIKYFEFKNVEHNKQMLVPKEFGLRLVAYMLSVHRFYLNDLLRKIRKLTSTS